MLAACNGDDAFNSISANGHSQEMSCGGQLRMNSFMMGSTLGWMHQALYGCPTTVLLLSDTGWS